MRTKFGARIKTRFGVNRIKTVQNKCNEFIRLRDTQYSNGEYFFRCISCKKIILLDKNGKNRDYHAGHYWRENQYGSVRFNEDNIHGQCLKCNRFLHGNLAEYEINLQRKIGQERFEQLKLRRNILKKYAPTELEELEKYFVEKIKQEELRLKLYQ